MPIRSEMKDRYPKDWPEIRARVRARSGDRCECTGQCGLDHASQDNAAPPRCAAINGHAHPTTGAIVVLTVMHLDHSPEHNADDNLLHGCQQCHNRYDAPMRRAGIAERARAKCAASDLFLSNPTGKDQT